MCAFIYMYEKRGWDIRVTTPSQMSIRKTGIALWRGSGFLWRTLKKEQELFCKSLFFNREIVVRVDLSAREFRQYCVERSHRLRF